MTMAALTLPRAFAVRFKDAHVWSVGSFVRVEWNWPEEHIRPLSKALHRRVEEVDRKQHSIEDLQLVTLHLTELLSREIAGARKILRGDSFSRIQVMLCTRRST
jgi:hypothetical protein